MIDNEQRNTPVSMRGYLQLDFADRLPPYYRYCLLVKYGELVTIPPIRCLHRLRESYLSIPGSL